MKTRIIASVIYLPLILIIFLALPPIFTALLLAAMCAVGAWELTWSTGLVRHPRLVVYTMLAAIGVALWNQFGSPHGWGVAGGMVFAGALFCEMLVSKAKLPFEKILVCIAAGLLAPYLLCSLVRLRNMELGKLYILLPLVIAFMSDTFAYFVGMLFGKHKLAPTISPKKTVEGFVGGIAGAVLGMMIFGVVLALFFGQKVNFFYGIFYGVLGSLGSVLGDLTFSVVKRQTGIKDYGKIIPGHGGIWDRFDSVSIVAPLTEALLVILPFAESIHG